MPAEPLKVFVCHSAIGDAAAKRLVDALQASLEPECACFIDWTELEVGKPWREPINLWLEHCDAGIVVLNHRALASSFVGYEVSGLIQRLKDGAGAFELIPIHVKNADPALSVGYGTLQQSLLGPWQLDAIDAEIYDPTQDPTAAAIAGRIKARLAAASARRVPLSPQIEKIVELLAMVPDGYLKRGLAKVEIRLRQLRPISDDERVRLALALRSLGLDQARVVIQELRGNVCDRANHWQEIHLRQLYDLLALFWVNPQSAAAIADVAAGPHERRNLALVARHNPIARLHVHRACPKVPADNEWMIAAVQAIGGEELGDDGFLTGKVRQALVDGLATTADDLPVDLDVLDADANPVFVTLPSAQPLPARVTRLRQDFKSVTFVFLTRGAGGAQPEDARVRQLAPAIEPEDEDVFFDGYERNWRLLKPRCPGAGR